MLMSTVSLGMTYEEAKQIGMFGAAGGYSEQEIAEAMSVLYPYRDAEGNVVSQQMVDSGSYQEADEGVYEYAGGGGAGACGTEPERPEDPPLYPAEYCVDQNGIPDAGCVERNYQRQQANIVLRENRRNQWLQALCEWGNCLNDTSRNCQAEYPIEAVPYAPGNVYDVAPDDRGIMRPTSQTPAVLPQYTASETAAAPPVTAAPNRPPAAGQPASSSGPGGTAAPGGGEAAGLPSAGGSSTPSYGFFEQLQQGGGEVVGGISESTGLSSGVVMAAAAALGAYLLLKG